mmetsp:Transcript_39859/g.53997  ORF Transcript_39859/g.53997 Transcript_39859/m.53997 type:complete len:134 (-) Transcript_39859:302-703(-)
MARQQNSRLLLPLLVAAALILAVVPVRQAFVGPAPSTLRGSALTQSSRSVDVARAATGYPLDDSDLVQPDQEPERITYLIGFVRFAENLNGRVAMIGFFVLIFLEYFSDRTIISIVNEFTGAGIVNPSMPGGF